MGFRGSPTALSTAAWFQQTAPHLGNPWRQAEDERPDAAPCVPPRSASGAPRRWSPSPRSIQMGDVKCERQHRVEEAACPSQVAARKLLRLPVNHSAGQRRELVLLSHTLSHPAASSASAPLPVTHQDPACMSPMWLGDVELVAWAPVTPAWYTRCPSACHSAVSCPYLPGGSSRAAAGSQLTGST